MIFTIFFNFLKILLDKFSVFSFRFLPGLVWTGSPIFSGNLSLSNQVLWNFLKGLIFLFLSTVQHCFFCRPSDRAQDCCDFGIGSQTLYTDKKKIQFSSYIRKFIMEQLQSHIWLTAFSYTSKYLRVSIYIRKPILINDFVTAPFWISLYMRKIWYSLLSV